MKGPLLSLLVLAVGAAHAIDVIPTSGNLHIVNKRMAPDGFYRDTVVAGTSSDRGSLPGPIIRGKKGDHFSLKVKDELVDPDFIRTTSVHWHGIDQKHTAWADGPSFITQCPIAPFHSFQYQFDVPDQAGTFWYHSHVGTQYCDGLRGAFIIEDPDDPHKDLYDVDDETTVITLIDWYHTSALALSQIPAPKQSNSTLINGVGRYPGGPKVPLAIINVEQGKRYRMRLLSMACDPNHVFSIDNHDMTVIETEGTNVEPVTVNAIQILAAQRYSFILHADQPVDNYRIRANASSGLALPDGGSAFGFEEGIQSAILRYKGAPDEEPKTEQQKDLKLLTESMLHPLGSYGALGEPTPGGADMVLNLTLGFQLPATFMINDVQFVSPSVPVLLQVLSGKRRAQELLPKGSVYGLPRNKTIEVRLFGNNAPSGPHPFHLHGHSFDVVKSADSDEWNFKNPPRRDTTSVAGANLTVIRFNTDNPGPWFLHCHIDFHLDFGLAVVLAEDAPDIREEVPVPEEWKQLCPTYNALPASLRPEQRPPPT
ncbi:hypothetical protein D9758_011376 [Tetrapyrgos nigripes]|uniref:laccase n=1 Tax=Tetrapyrgos nigripes TaxID=182062 RepID=A0A8H5G8G0_9AGAR|nr:hypothetical protein D9758_011376 [Tetrapyrgos nigripes]